MSGFYKLKCWVTESFYEYILEDGYTAVESVSRCLDEYGKQPGGPEALTVYSALFYRLVRYEAGALQHFQREIGEMNRLYASEALQAFSGDALGDLKEEVRIINRSLSQLMD